MTHTTASQYYNISTTSTFTRLVLQRRIHCAMCCTDGTATFCGMIVVGTGKLTMGKSKPSMPAFFLIGKHIWDYCHTFVLIFAKLRCACTMQNPETNFLKSLTAVSITVMSVDIPPLQLLSMRP